LDFGIAVVVGKEDWEREEKCVMIDHNHVVDCAIKYETRNGTGITD
jgi:hypothetical protein